jgi:hypothetical protein
LGFGYDGAGRLRQQAHYDTREYMQALEGQATPHTTRRWKIDPAGNRLPGKVITEQQQQQNSGSSRYANAGKTRNSTCWVKAARHNNSKGR